MPAPEQPLYQLRNEAFGLVEEAIEHIGEGEPCGSLELTMHGLRQAVQHVNDRVGGTYVILEASAPLQDPVATLDTEVAVKGLCQEVFDLSTELTEIIGNVRRGVRQCPGKCPGGACGLSPMQQQEAFWRKPPPMFIRAERYEP